MIKKSLIKKVIIKNNNKEYKYSLPTTVKTAVRLISTLKKRKYIEHSQIYRILPVTKLQQNKMN